MRLHEATLLDRLRLRYAKKVVEWACGIQLVCPYCGGQTTESVIAVWGGDVVYRCDRLYTGAGCGREYRGPA